MSKYQKYLITSTGIAEYPYLTSPDYAFSSDGLYQVKLVVSKEEAKKDVEIIDEVIAQKIADEVKTKPGMKVKNAPKPYEEVGDMIRFNFKCKASGINSTTKKPFTQKPVIKDRKNELFPEDKQIWSGSKLKISYEPVPYNVAGTGVGCTLRLKGVQVVDLVEGSSGVDFEPIEDTQEYSGLPVDTPEETPQHILDDELPGVKPQKAQVNNG